MIKIIAILLISILLVQCAQQTPITGGTRDTSAPKIDTLKKEFPLNGSVNFTAPTITINFNEIVVLKNADKQIIITPFPNEKPDIYTKGKKVIVDFKESLEPNTTYIINFGDAIADITEGNVFKNYKYVFSTGTFIDSLQYDAFVYDAFKKTPAKDILVMLYKQHEDSVVSLSKPSYFGKTNLFGKCNIQNIAAGEYKVVALDDKNGNYKFDPKEELIGYIDQRFDALNDTLADTIGVFLSRPEKVEITSSSVSVNGKGMIILNQPLPLEENVFEDSVLHNFIDGKYTISASRDTISYWIIPEIIPQKKYPMIVGNCKKENTFFKPPSDTTLKFISNATRNLKPQEDLSFVFTQPISKYDIEKITLKQDTISIPFEVIQTSFTHFVIAADYKIEFQYELEMLPGAFTSYYNVINDTIGALFEKNEANQYGNLLLSIQLNEGESFILELLKGDKVISRKYLSKAELENLDFQNLSAGNYGIKLIFDANKNNTWDTGDYYNRITPERVEFYNEVIDLKKGWDMDISWIIK